MSKTTSKHHLRKHSNSVLTVNRIPETIGYNIVYFVIGIGLVTTNPRQLVANNSYLLAALFGAIMFSKMQASVADALHDYNVDKENPEKSHIAESVQQLGSNNLFSLLAVELTLSLCLWGWISFQTNDPIYMILGAILSISGFLYSYPPRIKEKGILNHITTSITDVICVILPVALLLGGPIDTQIAIILIGIFLYVFAYHIAHQAADTYFDRQSGISTFTQNIGVGNSLLLCTIQTLAAAIIFGALNYYLSFIALSIGAAAYGTLYHQFRNRSEKHQSILISKWFSVSIWALALNGAVAIDLLL